ncbi:hypothetical protein CRM22_010597 [Opisthorchis felineus]|uniref:Uncharacterized protein n=1 Tax=Opisthorchis felineus TaxID=147828 RepID=A0A4S2KWG5_OPIFE|nr:hypothetical protein CRM22_010597 [Opisthorchis felineus]
MVICVTFIAVGCLVGALSRSIPPYDSCMEACGEDLLEDDVLEINDLVCRDQCNSEERGRCLAKHQNNEDEIRKCWKEALDRCVARCGDNDNRCLPEIISKP